MPVTWADILAKSQNHQASPALHRSPEVAVLYDLNRQHVAATYLRYSDFIKIHTLRWKAVPTADAIVAVRTRGSYLKRLTPNAYPYDVEPGITHLVLWSVRPLSKEETDETIRKQMCRLFKRQDLEVAWFINRVEHQSIADLWHAQVFLHCLALP
jgi:hypothetical protein